VDQKFIITPGKGTLLVLVGMSPVRMVGSAQGPPATVRKPRSWQTCDVETTFCQSDICGSGGCVDIGLNSLQCVSLWICRIKLPDSYAPIQCFVTVSSLPHVLFIVLTCPLDSLGVLDWPLTAVGSTANRPCPSRYFISSDGISAIGATVQRQCVLSADGTTGVWQEADLVCKQRCSEDLLCQNGGVCSLIGSCQCLTTGSFSGFYCENSLTRAGYECNTGFCQYAGPPSYTVNCNCSESGFQGLDFREITASSKSTPVCLLLAKTGAAARRQGPVSTSATAHPSSRDCSASSESCPACPIRVRVTGFARR